MTPVARNAFRKGLRKGLIPANQRIGQFAPGPFINGDLGTIAITIAISPEGSCPILDDLGI